MMTEYARYKSKNRKQSLNPVTCMPYDEWLSETVKSINAEKSQ